jgi:hypothetical protein
MVSQCVVRIKPINLTRNKSRAAKAVTTNATVTTSEQYGDTTESCTRRLLVLINDTCQTEVLFTLLLEFSVDAIGVLRGQFVFVFTVAD